jgi:hypothetical protein
VVFCGYIDDIRGLTCFWGATWFRDGAASAGSGQLTPPVEPAREQLSETEGLKQSDEHGSSEGGGEVVSIRGNMVMVEREVVYCMTFIVFMHGT